MENRRRYKRFDVQGIHGTLVFASKVNILNLGIGGAALETDRRLDIGDTYTLRLKGGKGSIAPEGVVTWSFKSSRRMDPSGSQCIGYRTGLRFTEAATGSNPDFVSYLKSLNPPTGGLEAISLPVDAPPRAIIKRPSVFILKNISQGGLLIASDNPVKPHDRLSMKLKLAGHVAVNFTCKVTHCMRFAPGESGEILAGVEFQQMPSASRDTVTQFIDALEGGR